MRSFVIDSNILIYHLQGEEAVRMAIARWSREGDRLFISAITRIEVLAAPVMKEGEEGQIARLLDQFVLLPVEGQVADIAARIRRHYRLELGDSIIAATALLHNASVVTRNVKDFRKVNELGVEKL